MDGWFSTGWDITLMTSHNMVGCGYSQLHSTQIGTRPSRCQTPDSYSKQHFLFLLYSLFISWNVVLSLPSSREHTRVIWTPVSELLGKSVARQ